MKKQIVNEDRLNNTDIMDQKIEFNTKDNNSIIIKDIFEQEIMKINSEISIVNYKNKVKVDKDKMARLNELFKSIPEIAKIIKDKNTYEVIYDKGVGVLQKSAKHPGYLLGNIVDSETNNNYKGSALLKNSSKKQIIISSIYSVMSHVTSQYYLNNIDNKLESVFLHIDQIKSFLRDDKRSDLESYEHYLQQIIKRESIIYENEIYRQSVLNELQSIQNKIYSSIKLYEKQIYRHKEELCNNKKEKNIQNMINNDLTDLISAYKYSVVLYMKCKLIETIISEIHEEKDMYVIVEDLIELKEIYKDNLNKWNTIYEEFINSAKVYNENKLLNSVANLKNINNNNLKIKSACVVIGTIADQVNKSDKKTKNLKKEIEINHILHLFKDNSDDLNNYIESLSYYNLLYTRPLKIIKNDNRMYICISDDVEKNKL